MVLTNKEKKLEHEGKLERGEERGREKNKNKQTKQNNQVVGNVQTVWLKMKRLLVAATAMQFSVGCQAW